MNSAPATILQGILIFVNRALRELLDIKIFVDTDADLAFNRRLVRDILERGRTVESVVRNTWRRFDPRAWNSSNHTGGIPA